MISGILITMGYVNSPWIGSLQLRNVVGEQGPALDTNFLNSLISFFNARGLKLGHFDIFILLYPFLAFFKL